MNQLGGDVRLGIFGPANASTSWSDSPYGIISASTSYKEFEIVARAAAGSDYENPYNGANEYMRSLSAFNSSTGTISTTSILNTSLQDIFTLTTTPLSIYVPGFNQNNFSSLQRVVNNDPWALGVNIVFNDASKPIYFTGATWDEMSKFAFDNLNSAITAAQVATLKTQVAVNVDANINGFARHAGDMVYQYLLEIGNGINLNRLTGSGFTTNLNGVFLDQVSITNNFKANIIDYLNDEIRPLYDNVFTTLTQNIAADPMYDGLMAWDTINAAAKLFNAPINALDITPMLNGITAEINNYINNNFTTSTLDINVASSNYDLEKALMTYNRMVFGVNFNVSF